MKWYLVKVILDGDDQLEFDFMDTNKGYEVFALGENEEDAIDRMKRLHANRNDLQFIMMGETEIGQA